MSTLKKLSKIGCSDISNLVRGMNTTLGTTLSISKVGDILSINDGKGNRIV